MQQLWQFSEKLDRSKYILQKLEIEFWSQFHVILKLNWSNGPLVGNFLSTHIYKSNDLQISYFLNVACMKKIAV
jgi:hypothetical protein